MLEKLRHSYSTPPNYQPIVTPILTLIHPLSLCDMTNSTPCVLQAIARNTYFLDCECYPFTNPSIVQALSSLVKEKGIRVIATDGSIHSVRVIFI